MTSFSVQRFGETCAARRIEERGGRGSEDFRRFHDGDDILTVPHEPDQSRDERVLGDGTVEEKLHGRSAVGMSLLDEVAEAAQIVGVAPEVREDGEVKIFRYRGA